MKILIITGLFPPDIGGPATYSKILIEKLPKEGGFDVSVLSFGEVRDLPRVIRHLAFFFRIISRGRSSDLFFAQDPVSVGLPTLLASKILRIPYVIKIVGDYAWEQGVQRAGIKDSLDVFVGKRYFSPLVLVLKTVERVVARFSKRIIVPSQYLRGIVEKWGVKKSRVFVIQNSFSDTVVHESKDELRSRLKITSPTIVSVGRLVPWKGFASLIETVSILKKRGVKAMLLIIGDGGEKKNLLEIIRKEDLEKDVSLLGKLPQSVMLNYVRAADIFVLNSTYEGFSHQLLETFAAETPIVATNAGGNKEIIEHRKNGLLVSPGNLEELAGAIEEVINSSNLREEMVDHGKKTLIKFSEDIMVSKTAILFRSL